MRLAGKRALVTGAASGIGEAVVSGFRAEGAQVWGADIDFTTDNFHFHLDVTQEREWEGLMESIGRLDCVVGCAGIADVRAIQAMTLADWRRVMAVNLDGAFLTVRYGAQAMRDTQGGTIVLVGSASGIKPAPQASAYCASKAAVRMLAKCAALELKAAGIRVNCVSPAGVVTPMWRKMPFWQELVTRHGSEEGAWNELGSANPDLPSIQRMAFPNEVASAIVFLSSDESAHITGADLAVDAGYTA